MIIKPIPEILKNYMALTSLIGMILQKRTYSNTVDSRYLELTYLEQPLISKWKSGPCFNTEIYQQATKYCGKEEK